MKLLECVPSRKKLCKNKLNSRCAFYDFNAFSGQVQMCAWVLPKYLVLCDSAREPRSSSVLQGAHCTTLVSNTEVHLASKIMVCCNSPFPTTIRKEASR